MKVHGQMGRGSASGRQKWRWETKPRSEVNHQTSRLHSLEFCCKNYVRTLETWQQRPTETAVDKKRNLQTRKVWHQKPAIICTWTKPETHGQDADVHRRLCDANIKFIDPWRYPLCFQGWTLLRFAPRLAQSPKISVQIRNICLQYQSFTRQTIRQQLYHLRVRRRWPWSHISSCWWIKKAEKSQMYVEVHLCNRKLEVEGPGLRLWWCISVEKRRSQHLHGGLSHTTNAIMSFGTRA